MAEIKRLTFDDVYKILKEETSSQLLKEDCILQEIHFIIGPKATPESLLIEGRKLMSHICAGNCRRMSL